MKFVNRIIRRSKELAWPNVLAQEAELARPEVCDVGENLREISRRDAEPLRQRGPILVDCRGWNQDTARVGVVRAARREQREIPVELSALHAASDDEMMIAPGVIAAIDAAGRQGAPEFGRSER